MIRRSWSLSVSGPVLVFRLAIGRFLSLVVSYPFVCQSILSACCLFVNYRFPFLPFPVGTVRPSRNDPPLFAHIRIGSVTALALPRRAPLSAIPLVVAPVSAVDSGPFPSPACRPGRQVYKPPGRERWHRSKSLHARAGLGRSITCRSATSHRTKPPLSVGSHASRSQSAHHRPLVPSQ